MIQSAGQGILKKEIKEYRVHFIIALLSMLLFYSIPLVLNKELVATLGVEDAIIENLTALFLLLASVVFLILLIRTKHLIYLVFFLVFFFGGAEEISWGQRIFNYETPESIEERNVQREFNIHNLERFSSYDSEGAKEGIARFLNFYTVFTLFWFLYCIILPLVWKRIKFIGKIVQAIRLPVPPLLLGLAFLLNYVLHEVIMVIISRGEYFSYYSEYYDETYELCPGIFFFLIAIVFLQQFRRNVQKTDALPD
jgi:hypothetical protein